MKSTTTSRAAFRGKLLAYTSVSAAALAIASKAEAQPVNTITLGSFSGGSLSGGSFGSPGTSGSFMVNGQPISLQLTATGAPHSYGVWSATVVGGGAMFDLGAGGNPANLAYGAAMGNFGANNLLGRETFAYRLDLVAGNFINTQNGGFKTGYLAFKVGSYQGWVGISMGRGNRYINSVNFYDKNGDGIYGAFSTRDITVGYVPEPSTVALGLGLLALGAAGVREHRRRKQVAA